MTPTCELRCRGHAPLEELADGVHGDRPAELSLALRAYRQALGVIEPRQIKEERVVFAAINWLEAAQTPVKSGFGSLDAQFSDLLTEHDVVGELFREMRVLTDGYAAPTDSCNSYRAMLRALKEMELAERIHDENHILLPQVFELEQRLAGR